MKIAWIGTGIMGKAMLLHLHNANHEISVYNRTIEKAFNLKECGINVCNTIQECVQDAEVIFTMVGYPHDVEDIYTSEIGILKHAKKGAVLIDMTTSSPQLAVKLAKLAKQKSLYILDAPVSGGDTGAKNATLSIMVGGDQEAYTIAYPLFELMGKQIHYLGKAGNGQHAKAANQIAVAGAVAAMSEAIHYMRVNGLSQEDTLSLISKGAAGSWQLENNGPRVLANNYEPGFYIKHFIKDMKIVQNVMKEHQETLPMLNTVCDLYEQLQENGHENEGTQALIKYYEEL